MEERTASPTREALTDIAAQITLLPISLDNEFIIQEINYSVASRPKNVFHTKILATDAVVMDRP